VILPADRPWRFRFGGEQPNCGWRATFWCEDVDEGSRMNRDDEATYHDLARLAHPQLTLEQLGSLAQDPELAP
jgi:hypothetical protein